MADIAFIFHWTPADMLPLRVSRLLDWRDKARARWRSVHEVKR